jgi:hypothetical protein
MLRLRTTSVLARDGNRNSHQSGCCANARQGMLRVWPAQQQSKVGFRSSRLALQAHRGDEVAAFLVATDTKEAAGGEAAGLLAAEVLRGAAALAHASSAAVCQPMLTASSNSAVVC